MFVLKISDIQKTIYINLVCNKIELLASKKFVFFIYIKSIKLGEKMHVSTLDEI